MRFINRQINKINTNLSILKKGRDQPPKFPTQTKLSKI